MHSYRVIGQGGVCLRERVHCSCNTGSQKLNYCKKLSPTSANLLWPIPWAICTTCSIWTRGIVWLFCLWFHGANANPERHNKWYRSPNHKQMKLLASLTIPALKTWVFCFDAKSTECFQRWIAPTENNVHLAWGNNHLSLGISLSSSSREISEIWKISDWCFIG